MRNLSPRYLAEGQSNGMTVEQLEEFIEKCEQLSNRIVVTHILDVFEKNTNGDAADNESMAAKIRAMQVSQSIGKLDLPLPNLPYILVVQLSIVPVGYKIDVGMPKEIIPVIQSYIEYCKYSARLYYYELMHNNPEVFDMVQQLCPNINWSELQIDDESHLTLYLDKATEKRIGIFIYYTDSEGNPLVKKK